MDSREEVLACLEYGSRNAKDRYQISNQTGIQDRHVRRLIEELRGDGYLICNAQNGKGYYLAETPAEILRQYRQDHSRAMSILKRMKTFRHALIEAAAEENNQMTFNEILNTVFVSEELE